MDRGQQTDRLALLLRRLVREGAQAYLSDARPRLAVRIGKGEAVNVVLTPGGDFTWVSAHGTHRTTEVEAAAAALLPLLRLSSEEVDDGQGPGGEG